MTDSDVEDAPKLSCLCRLLDILGRGNSGGMVMEPVNDGLGEDVVDEIWLPKAFTLDESISFLVA